MGRRAASGTVEVALWGASCALLRRAGNNEATTPVSDTICDA